MDETTILIPFLNRAGEFDPAGWFQLVPKGTFPISRKEKDKVRTYQQVVDDVACDKIVAAFQNRQAKNPGFQLLVGFEHFAHEPGQSSEAACWVNALEKRPDGVWAKGEWTDLGAAAIKNRRYRYLSPVWFPRQTEPIAGDRFRPIEVNDAGLTNMPNLGDALQPFWNRSDENFHGREATSENQNQSHMKDRLILICGLAATATDDQLVAAVEAFKNRASSFETLQGTHATLTSEHTALKNRHTSLLATSVDQTLEDFKGVITEEAKDAWKNRLTADFEGTTALLKGIKPAAAGKGAPLHKAGKGAAAAAAAHAETVEDEGDAFMNRATELSQERKISKDEAQLAVAREEPELYAAYRNRLLGLEAAK